MSTSESPDRLAQLQQELATVLEERLGALSAVLQASEATTRRILSAEMEIQRHKRDQTRLQAEATQMEAEAVDLASQADTLRSRHSEVLAARDARREELAALRVQVNNADAENERDRQRLAELDGQAAALRQENADLQSKLQNLEEKITRMKSLRDEIMNSMSGQSQSLTPPTNGND